MKNNCLSEKDILSMDITNERKIFLLTKKCGYPIEDAVLLVNDFHGVYFKSDKLINKDAGLTVKYEVRKKEDGSLVEGCFVLRPDKDPAAIEALRAYAAATPNKELSKDIDNWIAFIKNENNEIIDEEKHSNFYASRFKDVK